MLKESYIIRFKDFVNTLPSVIGTLYQGGYIKKKNIDGTEVYYIDEEAAKADEQIKRIIDKETLFAYNEIVDDDFDVSENEDDSDNPYNCFDGNRIREAASEEVRCNLYSINALYAETYLCDILESFGYSLPYLYNPNDENKLAAYQYNVDYQKNIYEISKRLLPSLRDREMIDINTLERVIYYAWEDFNDFTTSINKLIEKFNLNPKNINRKINYNLFNQPNTLVTPDKLCLNLKTDIDIKRLYQVLIEREYISPKTDLEDFYCLFNGSGNISQPIGWIKKTSKKQRSKTSLIDFLKLLGISTNKLHDKDLIAKYFLDDERKPMRLNLYNNKANEISEYYNELKDIIKKVSTK